MAAILPDPILPSLRSIRAAFDAYRRNPAAEAPPLKSLLEDCIRDFSTDRRYRDDIRFLKIWLIYADVIQDFERVFRMLEVKGICQGHSLLYEAYAVVLTAKGDLVEADKVYRLGISRNAEPLGRLKKMHKMFVDTVLGIARDHALDTKIDATNSQKQGEGHVDPYSSSTVNNLLEKLDNEMKKLNGYHKSNKAYSGKVSLTSLRSSSKKKIIELGGSKYQITGCSGQGAFAQVYKAYVESNPDDVVALKIQRPPFPWEFYMYRQLDKRISVLERSSFAFAHRIHIYSDWSILVCDYLSHGTLQDVVNSYLVMQKSMEEVVCIYYTIEMLRMLETLHNAGIIHGDFKPDNLLVRYARDELTDDGFSSRAGPWSDQGLCLVDWGKGIDMNLFPAGAEFVGDCRTSCFRCIEMQEKRAWTYQTDTYGLCGTAHMMLHGTYMSVEKITNPDGSCCYQPKAPFKRYWNVDLWKNLFSTLLNTRSNDSDVVMLQNLRKSFEDYMCAEPKLIKELKHLLVKQKASMCST